ncbi:MAG: hypothetical protein KBS81_03240 [Spirochaetales bacterium]|nr:hypothetical protein [Candidatus Physcosoma equi]
MNIEIDGCYGNGKRITLTSSNTTTSRWSGNNDILIKNRCSDIDINGQTISNISGQQQATLAPVSDANPQQ